MILINLYLIRLWGFMPMILLNMPKIPHQCRVVLQYVINSDLGVLFWRNYLQINAAKTQAVFIGPSLCEYKFNLNDKNVEMQDTLKILGVVRDRKLTFKTHIKEQLKKAFAKASALRRLRKFISKDAMVRLCKAYVLPHLEYGSPQFCWVLVTSRLVKWRTLTVIY